MKSKRPSSGEGLNSGPDRSLERRCDLYGLQVEGIDDLLELAAVA
jgi:hypothetical protein